MLTLPAGKVFKVIGPSGPIAFLKWGGRLMLQKTNRASAARNGAASAEVRWQFLIKGMGVAPQPSESWLRFGAAKLRHQRNAGVSSHTGHGMPRGFLLPG